MFRLGRIDVRYVGRRGVAALGLLLGAAGLTLGLWSGPLIVTLSPLAVAALWLLYAVRLEGAVPAGSGGPDLPPGIGVREPRRPIPKGPAGVAERPLPVE
jgi:hypothetical protein